MGYSVVKTHTHINRWAEIFQVNPVIFSGATISCSNVNVTRDVCDKVWPQLYYQNKSTASRDALALALQSAEQSIRNAFNVQLGIYWGTYSTALSYKESKMIRSSGGLMLRLPYRFFKATGTPSEELILNQAVVINDEDADGFSETAYVVFDKPVLYDDQSLPSKLEFFVYHNGDRILLDPILVDEINETQLRVKFNVWDIIKPSITYDLPRKTEFYEGYEAVDVCNVNNLIDEINISFTSTVSDVDIRVYYKNANCGSTPCEELMVEGCLTIIDDCDGWVRVYLKDFSCSEKEFTRIEIDYVVGCDCNLNEDCYLRAIALIAAARLTIPVCECGCDATNIMQYTKNTMILQQESYFRLTMDDMVNPIGTFYGELLAWKMLSPMIPNIEFGIVV